MGGAHEVEDQVEGSLTQEEFAYHLFEENHAEHKEVLRKKMKMKAWLV